MPSKAGVSESGPRKRKARLLERDAGTEQAAVSQKRVGEAPKDAEDSDALRSEVAAFASSLGLAASAESGGFDDSDFRPEAARKHIGSSFAAAGGNELERASADGKAPVAPRQRRADREGKGTSQGDQQQPPSSAGAGKAAAAPKGRGWNEGAGPPPGTRFMSENHVFKLHLAHSNLEDCSNLVALPCSKTLPKTRATAAT